MITPDYYAARSPLRRIDPSMKLFFALPLLGLCLWADSITLSLLLLLLMGSVLVLKGAVPLRVFVLSHLLPGSFLLTTIISISFDMADHPESFLLSFPVGTRYAGLTASGLLVAAHLFFKTIGSVSCLYFISLSTPLTDLALSAEKLGVPKLMIEMTGLVYRFLFILLETMETMITAQQSRLGYAGVAASYRSLGALSSTLFVQACRRSDEIYNALESRGYNGQISVLRHPFEKHTGGYPLIIAIHALLLAAALFLKQFSGGYW
jgi:cobalt/nickel transport system permease protein